MTARNVTILMLWICAIGAYGQTLNRGEYFFDSDPGTGKGIRLNFTPSAAIDATFSISTASLSQGFHTLNIRLHSSDKKWSHFAHRSFYIVPAAAVSNASTIVGGEYFFDSDPGNGKATVFGLSNVAQPNQNITIPISSLSAGFHNLNLRVRDNKGKWSHFAHRTFYVVPAATTTGTASLKRAEYFLDTDPGAGKGKSLAAPTGDNTYTVDVSTLSPGFHRLGIRVQDSNSRWSLFALRTFYVMPASSVVAAGNLTRLEYFIDDAPSTDPSAAGNNIPITPSASIDQPLVIDLTGVAEGDHMLYVRAKDNLGRWSIPVSEPFVIGQAPAFTATAPASNATITDVKVSYTLSKALALGSITWTRTGGTADGNSPHIQALAGTELAAGAHTNITLTNSPTLIVGAIYSVAFNGEDATGNKATTVTNTNVTFASSDVTPPTVSSINYQTPAISPTKSTSVSFRVTFSETVTGVDAADFTVTQAAGVTNGTPTVSAVSATVYDITVPSVTGNGTLRLDVLSAATIADGANNDYVANFTTGQVYTIDQTPPAFTSTSPASNAAAADSKVAYTLSEALASGSITWTRTGGSADANSPYVQTLTGTELAAGAHTAITLTNSPTLVNGVIYSITFNGTDAAGNAATPVTNTNIAYQATGIDVTPPTVTSINYQTPATSPTKATSVTFRVTISEPVTGVDASDFTITTAAGITNGTAIVSAVSTTVYDVTVPSITGSGTLRLDVLSAASFADVANNDYVADFTTGQIYAIDQAPPVFSQLSPAGNTTIIDTKVSYTLSEALASGSITWTRTGGTADAGSPHVQAFTGSELAAGAHSNIVLSSNPTLLGGAIYSITFNGTDAVGNAATAITNTNITFESTGIDVTPPTVNSIAYQTPATSPTGMNSVTFRVSFNEAVINVDAADFTVTTTGGVTKGAASVAMVSAAIYDVTVSAITGSGTVRLDVLGTAAIADASNNDYVANFTTGATYTIDQTAPVFTSTAPANGATITDAKVSYTASEALSSGSITWTRTGGASDAGSPHVQSLTGSELSAGTHANILLTNSPTLTAGTTYTITFNGTDAVGNAAAAVTNTNITYPSSGIDVTPPTVISINYQSPASSPTKSTSVTFRVTFSEAVVNVEVTDFTITRSAEITTAAATVSSAGAAVYDVTVPSINGSGTVRVDVLSSATVADAANNKYAASFTSGQTYTIDQTPPEFTSTAPPSDVPIANTHVSYTLSENLTSGTITWTRTGGTADDNSPHVQTLSGAELTTGPHTDIILSDNPALVGGAIYSIVFNGIDVVGNAATTITHTNVVYIPEDGPPQGPEPGTAPAVHAVITPTGSDEENNVLYIDNIEFFPHNVVHLLDRWGVPVKTWQNFVNYQTTNMTQQDFDFGSMSVGSYICVVEYNTPDGKKENVSQMVTVLKE